jgi:hypothetical protein
MKKLYDGLHVGKLHILLSYSFLNVRFLVRVLGSPFSCLGNS